METKETKEFWKTSEFWVMVLTQLATIITMISDALPPKYGVPAMGVVTAFYTIARGIAKSGNPVAPPAPTVIVTPPVQEVRHG